MCVCACVLVCANQITCLLLFMKGSMCVINRARHPLVLTPLLCLSNLPPAARRPPPTRNSCSVETLTESRASPGPFKSLPFTPARATLVIPSPSHSCVRGSSH
jgi:hypothetical protein